MTATSITHVGTVIVPVSDQGRALEFWLDTLGFEKRLDGQLGDGDRWLEVGPPGGAMTIELRGQGVDADEEIIRMGDYVPPMFTFRDPDGNRFRVVERS